MTNKEQSANKTSINNTVHSQETIKALKPEQLNHIKMILRS